ncbi:MAG: O-acetylhomoserine aminocarboxypropyltransferase/cysteine synthase [candidate division WOR-3 bacterium]|nr:MAG: O-acetylhomoserine aminocarboxypropyltransferase/cysteine synthase [candidate division WOR-3 bacterium]
MNNGVQKYVEKARKALGERSRYIRDEVKKWRFDTIAVHGAYSVKEAIDNNQGSIIEPIYMSTSQAFRDSDEMEAALAYLIPSWTYSRIHNPSIGYLEDTLALLEGYGYDGETTCCVVSSGMAAVASACDPFLAKRSNQPDEKINFVANAQIYGGTFQQFNVRKMKERGIECRWVVDPLNIDEWSSKIDSNTRFLFGELPSNPGLAFFDIAKVIDLAHENGIPAIFDTTIATPALLRPISLGADIVIHSVTKTLTASGFGIAGAVIARKQIVSNIDNDDLKKDFGTYIKLLPNRDMGWCLSPFQAILTLNDIRTLRSKVDVLSQNSMKVAQYLDGHKKVASVNYLGLANHPLHSIASKYLWLVDAEHDEQYGKAVNRYGHLMSFQLKGGLPAARKFFDGLKRIWRATDLGRIQSVATIPSISTHQQMGGDLRDMANIPEDLIRLCIGAEHPDDMIADLEQALESI